MNAFKFRLARVLRIRQVEEEAACTRFQECVAVMQRAQEIAQGLGDELRRSRDELFETRAHKLVPPEELLLVHNTLQSIEDNLAEQRRRAVELEAQAEELRAAWEATRRDREALEQLEARRRRDHFDAAEKQANLELDETALRRACGSEQLEPTDAVDDGGESDSRNPTQSR